MKDVSHRIAVVIPCYRVKRHIKGVLQAIGSEVSTIYVVDDCCPEKSGEFVQFACRDERIQVLFNTQNQGVGGATMSGYRKALQDGADIVVKLDGDGQMDPALIRSLISPLLTNQADYVKGNRFYDLTYLTKMPAIRLCGNTVLSFVNKLSSGYWNLMDPTNGFTAIHKTALEMLPLDKISKRYFFESEMLFRLGTIRAVVTEIPMHAHYGDETSSLNISRVALEFPNKYLQCCLKRIFYSYILRDFNLCSLGLLIGIILMAYGTLVGFGAWAWYGSQDIPAPLGTIMLAVLPFIMGFQLLLCALMYDLLNVPKEPLQNKLVGQNDHQELEKVHDVVSLQ
jgi:dolichol-phosphate mannosyltransferase